MKAGPCQRPPGLHVRRSGFRLLSDRFGRKLLLIVAAALFALSSVGTALAGSFGLFIANRLLGGVAIGLASNLSPMYIAEIAPARMRGTLVSVNQLTIVIGILLAQWINWMIAEPVAAKRHRERYPRLVERPDWLALDVRGHHRAGLVLPGGDVHRARKSTLAGKERTLEPGSRRADPDWRTRPTRTRRSWRSARRWNGTPIRETSGNCSPPAFAGSLVLGIVLAVFQQWCGINVIFNYGVKIFASAGYTVSDSLFGIVITGCGEPAGHVRGDRLG